MENFEKLFPALQRCTYLNTAASGLLSSPVQEFRRNHDQDFYNSGGIVKEHQEEELRAVREVVGRFFSCAAQRLALVPNFSSGFETLITQMNPKQKVLLLRGDYPSVNQAVERRGFRICYVELGKDLEERILDAIESEAPDIFAFSLVQYISGIRLDPQFLKHVKGNHPDLLLFADGTQFCGVESFSFDDSGIDVLGASAYKWLNAGYGNGFLLFSSSMDTVIPGTTGFQPLRGKHKPHQGDLIGRFEPGHRDTLSFGSLKTALELMEKIGMARIEELVRRNASHARAALEDRNLLDDVIVKRECHAPIYNISGDDTLFQKLRNRNIHCSRRGNGIRLSFHYFNTDQDIERLLQVLDS